MIGKNLPYRDLVSIDYHGGRVIEKGVLDFMDNIRKERNCSPARLIDHDADLEKMLSDFLHTIKKDVNDNGTT